MPDRVIAIGDIHGFWDALAALLEAIEPDPSDTIVTLGDYLDRGPQSPQVLEGLIALGERCRLVPILGNHDEMVRDLYHGCPGVEAWLSYGGRQTLAAYGCRHPSELPEEHIDYLESCLPYYETDTHFFLHASYLADVPLPDQPTEVTRWQSIRYEQPGPHISGKIAVVGHTAQREGEILDLGHLLCIDTCCYCGKWLTALDVTTGQVWQASPDGKLRAKE